MPAADPAQAGGRISGRPQIFPVLKEAGVLDIRQTHGCGCNRAEPSAGLAAIRFAPEDEIDTLLADVAGTLRAEGWRVSGALQLRGKVRSACRCSDMDLRLLSDGRLFRISQPLGNGARGCRLDPGGLAACSAALEQEIAAGCDLLILNRFGKGESEGRGFRDLIGMAIAADIPVLTAVRETYAAEWRVFGRGVSIDLPPDRSAILAWFHDLPQTAACPEAA